MRWGAPCSGGERFCGDDGAWLWMQGWKLQDTKQAKNDPWLAPEKGFHYVVIAACAKRASTVRPVLIVHALCKGRVVPP